MGELTKRWRVVLTLATGIYLMLLGESAQQLRGLAPSLGAVGVECIPAWTMVLWCALACLPTKHDSLEEMQSNRRFALGVAWVTPAALSAYMVEAWRLWPRIDTPPILGMDVAMAVGLSALLALAARTLLARLPAVSFERRATGTKLGVFVLLPVFVALVFAAAARRATRSTVDSIELGGAFVLAEGRASMRVPLSDGRALVLRRSANHRSADGVERVRVSRLEGLHERMTFDVGLVLRDDRSVSISIDERVGVVAVSTEHGTYRAAHSLQTGARVRPWTVRARLAPGLLWLAQCALAAALLAYAMASHRRWRASREPPSIGPYRESALMVCSIVDEQSARELARVQTILAVALAQGSPLLFALFAGMLGPR